VAAHWIQLGIILGPIHFFVTEVREASLESIESRVQAFGLTDRVGRVMIPTEPVTEIINGKKRTVERVFLPGYVLVEMDLDNNLWHVLKDTPKVTGFVGGHNPTPLTPQEVDQIVHNVTEAAEKPKPNARRPRAPNSSARSIDGTLNPGP